MTHHVECVALLVPEVRVTTIADFLALVGQLARWRSTERGPLLQVQVPAGLRLPVAADPHGRPQADAGREAALVGERPEVFEVQFTAGEFGWVVVHLDRIERDELAELTYEAWRLSAPGGSRGDRLPV